ncbi:BINDING PROTEIN putative-RELATED [Salix purpurea]|uniref:BINDING PROTEIN putative-RELATED n=1 Tax=Salix purpurea TaxID=77065 RepID=A0A9Q0WIV3_SALPP|nr:BINDING PROTEIN putative-RELATED [Salix purpurea]
MLLAINKEPVTCFQDVENACQALENCVDSDGKLKITICRQGAEVDLLVGTDIRDGNGTMRALSWCGCLVQDPHPAVRALGFLPGEGHGVYAAMWSYGSPAERYFLGAVIWIVHVNGKPTPDLDAFANVVKGLRYDEFVRVKTINLDGKPHVLTLKQDLHYWPTWELRFDPNTATWRRETIKALDCNNE